MQAIITHSDELVREIRNEVSTGTNRPKGTAGDALLRLAKLGEELGIKGPADLSSRIDDYLYGDK
jgi:hypothetical protein